MAASLSWAFAASLTPLSGRPYPVGSGTGSIWRLLFVYNGADRLTGNGAVSAIASGPSAGPGPLRLLDAGGSHYGSEIGTVLLAALVLGSLALAARGHLRAPASLAGRCTAALVLWLLTGAVLFSVMKRLEPRYLEVVAPAACAVLAIAVARLARDPRRSIAAAVGLAALGLAGYLVLVRSGGTGATAIGVLAACAAAAIALRSRVGAAGRTVVLGSALAVELFAGPLAASLTLIDKATTDSASSDPINPRLSAYLVAHRGTARFELVAGSVFNAVGVVASDGLPVLVLSDVSSRIVGLPQLRSAVATGQVRYFYSPGACRPRRRCLTTTRFSLANSSALPHSQLRRYTPSAARLAVSPPAR